jgi:hypothetical protein
VIVALEEQQKRHRAVREAIASARLEGREVGLETQNDMRQYAEGEITEEEMLARFQKRVKTSTGLRPRPEEVP